MNKNIKQQYADIQDTISKNTLFEKSIVSVNLY